MRLHLDFETASEIDLIERGLRNYVAHPSTFVLIAGWAVEDGPIRQASFDEGFEELRLLIESPTTEIHAWNAPFEFAVMHYVLRWRVTLDRMRCTMAHALYRAFPAKLDTAAKAILDRGKLDGGTRLINLWSIRGGRPKPGDWDRFLDYNRTDVEVERGIHDFFVENNLSWPEHERDIWLMGEQINWRGFHVDIDATAAAKVLHDRVTATVLNEIQQITGVENPNSPQQLATWLHCGSLDKKHMPELLASREGDERRVLELRQQIALSAPKKYTVALQQEHGHRVRNQLQYSGAGRTHRWSGRALQPHNMRRGMKSDADIAQAWHLIQSPEAELLFDDPFTVLADLVRSIITHSKGGLLAVADYSSIEVVMLHWAAKDAEMLEKLGDGLDAYKVFAAKHWDTTIESVTKDQRTFAKPVVLGAGYGLGKDTLVEYAKGMGVTMNVGEASAAIATYRETNQPIVRLWYETENAMRASINNPGRLFRYHHALFYSDGRCTQMGLPSGSTVTYWDARIDEKTGRISYWGVNQYSGQWSILHTRGSKLVENLIQTISRDVLVYGLQNAMRAGLDVVLHVHDEIVVEADLARPEADLATLLAGMVAPPWCPDAPIKAAGFLCPRYRKD